MARKELAAFGSAVRQYRSSLSLSQEELAERSGLHRTYVSGIERGERNVGLINVYRLADALKISPAELFSAADSLRRRSRRIATGR